jgi:acyl transferase domain-containing protein/short-subunit dehydrogenase/acyl carrier protein
MSSEEQLRQYLRRATREVRKATSRVSELEAASREPIAIVGMSCRYPGGAHTPQQLWDLLERETDAISTYPTNRGWDLERLYDPDPDRAGTVCTRYGGFLHDAGEFDADFFRLSPREALAMDPQQRLMLELAWEACEDAGIAPPALHGSATGVFAGVIHDEYGAGAGLDSMPPGTEAYRYGGTASSVFCGRVAYGFGLQGPAVAIDTACSSSLVALHLACQALRQGECSLALAGGVTVMSTTSLLESFARQRALSPDGRCKAFAAAADGAGFSEGAGVLVLERLSDAVRNEHLVQAVIRGSAVNQDGASNGLTAPNGPSQERVIRAALANAGLAAADVDVVEAHGTGTPLGDPIEAQALLATYGQGRLDGPVLLGSLKSNVGHTSAAAGVGGVIKMVMAMRHERLPATLHVDAPSPHVDWSLGEAQLLREPVAWPRGQRPRRAGVSSFGASGTNAHLVLEEPPPRSPEHVRDPDASLGAYPFVLSAKSVTALRAQAERLCAHLRERPELAARDVAFSLAASRAHLQERAAVVAADLDTLCARLDSLAHDAPTSDVVRGTLAGGKTVFVFPGQGAQWEGMALDLLETSPVFAQTIAACSEAFSRYVDWSLEDVLRGGGELERVDVLQPALFAVMVSLAALWRSHGVEPAMVVGHSQGEIAAAYVAGGLSLDDAARVVTLRSQALADELAGRGGMVSVALGAEQLGTLLERWQGRLSLAALNAPEMLVVSGDDEALDELLAECESRQVRARRIAVDYASHSAHVQALDERLHEALSPLAPRSGAVAFFSTVTGTALDTAELGADYWYRSLREPVQFERATRELIAAGAHAFIEISPHPVLTVAVQATIDSVAESDGVVTLGSLRRDEGTHERFLVSLAEAHVNGVAVDLPSLFRDTGARRVELPTYAFQRERYWLESATSAGDVSAVGLAAASHPLLGAALSRVGEQGWTFTGSVSLATHPWLADHVVADATIVPAAALAELALQVGAELDCETLEELTFETPLVLGGEHAVALQCNVDAPDADGRRAFAIHSQVQSTGAMRPRIAGEWTRHASGVLADVDVDADAAEPEELELREFSAASWPPEDAQPVELASLYDRLLALGFAYGPAFQGVVGIWKRGDEAFAEVTLDEAQAGEAARFGVHPALFDAALHGLCVLDAGESSKPGELQLPFAWSDVRLHARGAGALRIRLAPADDGGHSLLALDGDGEPLLSVRSLAARPVAADRLARAVPAGADDSLFTIGWVSLGSSVGPGQVASGAAGEARLSAAGEAQQPASIGRLSLAGVEEHHADLSALVAAVADGVCAPEVVFAELPHDAAELGAAAAAHARACATLALLQAWLAQESLASSRLVLLTRGAIAVRHDEDPDPAAAAALGLVRSAQSEHPGQFVTLDVDDGEPPWGRLRLDDEPQLALRDGELYAPRLTPARGLLASTPAFDSCSTVLITGGTSGLGALLARHLVVAHGVERLLLVSRRGSSADGAQDLVDELVAHGCDAQLHACDVAERDELAALLATIPAEHPLTGVIHAAGVLDDGVLETLTPERLLEVMRPKLNGALNLHELTAGLQLAQFVLFSSAAGLFGAAGQGNYSAANAFLDALAQHRRAHGLAATSLAWGLWSQDSAMTGALERSVQARIARLGMLGLESRDGLELFDRALADGDVLLAPVRLDRQALLAQARVGMLPALLRSLIRLPGRRRRGHGGDLARRLLELPESEWDAAVGELVRAQVAALLGHESADVVDAGHAFKDLGLDSLAGVELRNRLARVTGLRLPATLIFDHPTVAAVVKLLRSRVEQREHSPAGAVRRAIRAREPIAIVGMGCRYPGGVSSPEELWELIAAGADAISPFPRDRGWDLERLFDPDPDHRGTSYAREGGFLEDAGEFDAGFFGISPREALAMDPQQRLMLEVAWESIEDARIDPSLLRGSETSVFAGASASSYLGAGAGEHEGLALTGTTTSVVSGRVAYALGLEGSAISIDTACSSSLVALHLACQSLQAGECSMALAGGVTVQATPGMFIEFSRQRGLSADGRCKSFGAGADGTIWSEGAGMLLLERLEDARRNGHRVQAVIRASATNQDGASNGLTAPHGPSQERVIAQALANAELSPADVDVVEAHGTGTTLGDPIEAQALLATYGQGRRDGPLRLGSIKSNIGHGIASAGVAGVIKMVMAMRHGVLPQTLHAEEPSPHVDWSSGEIRLLTLPEIWVKGERPRRAGISSFGVSGTNAHVILEEPPPVPQSDGGSAAEQESRRACEPPQSTPVALLLSAASTGAVRSQARRLGAHLQAHPELTPVDVALSLASTRTQFTHRAAVLGSACDELIEKLEALGRGESAAGVLEGAAGPGRTAFMFSGQGAQRAGMGRELYDAFPVFARALDACCAELDRELGCSLKEVLFAAESSSRAALLDRTEFTQAGLFALEVALFRLLESLGVEADVLIGHSVGELVAAHVAGVLDLADACVLVAARGRLMGALPEGGAMLAVQAGEQDLAGALDGQQRLALAAVNGPRALVVSGERDAIDQLEQLWSERPGSTTRLRVSHAFHSPLMDPMLAEFREIAAGVAFRAPAVPIVSGLSGEEAGAEIQTAEYWVRQIRETVRFGDGVKALERAGVTRFLELGPAGVLAALARDSLSESLARSALAAPALRTDRGELESLTRLLSEAHLHGMHVDWRALLADRGAREVDLPTYAFQRERYWHLRSGPQDLARAGLDDPDHPLLSTAVRLLGSDEWLFSGRLSLATHPWLADHAVLDTVLLAGTGFLELALAAGRVCGCETIEELTLEAPLVLELDRAVRLQLRVEQAEDSGARAFALHVCAEDAPTDDAADPLAAWTRCASGVLAPAHDGETSSDLDMLAWPPPGAEPIDVGFLYDRLSELGFGYGSAFQLVRAAWRAGEEVFVEVSTKNAEGSDALRFALHPALLDAALHPALVDGADAGVRMPFSWRDVRLHRHGATSLRVRIAPAGDGAMSITAVDPSGAPVIAIAAVVGRPVEESRLRSPRGGAAEDALFRIEWTAVAPPADIASPRLALLADVELDARGERYVDLAALGEALAAGAPVPEFVLASAAADEAEAEAAAHRAVARTLELLQAWLADERLSQARLVLLTRNALAVEADASPALAQAALAGLVRSAQSEHPGRFVLLDVLSEDASLLDVRAALAGDEPQLALRNGALYAPRLVRVPAGTAEPSRRAAGPDGTVLVTGGTGDLGALVARHLATVHGVRKLVLVSRGGSYAAGAADLVAELAELGCEARAIACDVGDREQLAELLRSISPEHPLTAVIHAAGVLEDGVIEALSAEQLKRVMRPKVSGALNLHALLGEQPVELVMFSSAAATIGSPGQGAYAAANALLDALAHTRRAQGLGGVSLAWGLWDQAGGMAGGLGAAGLERVRRLGISTLTRARGLELLDAARGLEQALLLPVGLDLFTLRAQARLGMLPAPLRGLVRSPSPRERDRSGALVRRLAGAPVDDWDAIVLEVVRAEVNAVLGRSSADALDPERAFSELGFDSLAAVELRNRLFQATGVRLAATLVFDHPTTAAVARFLRSRLDGETTSVPVRRAVARTEEPIAIVGLSCRYPGGVSSPEELWELLATRTDAISPFPDDRGWDLEHLFDPDPGHLGTSYAREGGFVRDAADFDPEFFGISPREALSIDPQQRLLLEGAWEACERAGIDPASLRGSDTGVFAGVMYQDYGVLAGSSSMRDELEGYLTIGSAGSVASGRVAYTFGFEGPAMTVDTACSSSLVALHLASQALRQGECSLALAGGVTVLCSPTVFVDFSRQRGLAPDGRCKSFAGAADGVGWAEGFGLLLIERLSDARRNGHEVLALVRASAVNQDGASNGMVAPNGPAQERVIRQALANAGLAAHDVQVVEGHGTGTTLGDPIEAQALLATYGQHRTDGPLRLGSIKSNIGHTQAAAGVAGVIKMVMAMRHGELPATLHVDRASPHVDWSAGELRLLDQAEPWPAGERPRRAGVSSFGVSGTNAHVILEEAPSNDATAPGAPALLPALPAVALVVSARSEEALQAQAGRLCEELRASPGLEAMDVATSLAARARFDRRAVVVGGTREELADRLGSLARGEVAAGVFDAAVGSGATAFMFAGQGGQRAGMGSELHQLFPTFAAAFDEVCAELDPHLGRSLKEVMFAPADSPQAALLDATAFTQPALFALEVALFRLLESLGVRPDFLIGHSIGELAAAHVAGVLSLADVCTLVAARGRLMGGLPRDGAMLAVAASELEVREGLLGVEAKVSLAAVNAPHAVVIAGDRATVETLESEWRARWRVRRLRVSHAFHSPQIDAMLEQFGEIAAGLSYERPRIAIVSNVSGERVDEEIATPGHWVRHARDTVRFADGIASLRALGVTRYLGLGPDGVLAAAAGECLAATVEQDALLASTLRARRGEAVALLEFLAAAHSRGIAVDWPALYAGRGASPVELPTYAFQRKRYWPERRSGPSAPRSGGHPLVSEILSVAGRGQRLLTAQISLARQPWLADHAVFGSVLVPGTLLVELAFLAGSEVVCETIEELTLELPLLVPEQGTLELQLQVAEPGGDARREISIFARRAGAESGMLDAQTQWSQHASGVLAPTMTTEQARPDPAAQEWPPLGSEELEIDSLYSRLAQSGFDYGPAFQGVRRAWRRGSDVFAEVSLEGAQAQQAPRFAIHPILFDGALHALVGGQGPAAANTLALPFSWTGLRLHRAGASSLRVHLEPTGEDSLRVTASDQTGAPVLSLDALRARPVDVSQLAAAQRTPQSSLFALDWRTVSLSDGEAMPYRLASLGGLESFEQIDRYDDLSSLATAVEAGAPAPEVVLAAIAEAPIGLAGADLATAARANVQQTLELLRAWVSDDRFAHSTLAVITRGAVAVRDGERPDLATASLWGLVRSAQSEHPDRFLLIDVAGAGEAIDWRALLATEEPQLALRDGCAHVPRLAAVPQASTALALLDGEVTVLITGGTGGLGALVARHLARERGVRHLLLVGRRGADAPGAGELVAGLAELGCTAVIAACDVADRHDLEALLGEIPAGRPLGAVVHAAGVLDDGTIGSLTAEQVQRVMRPKLDGALHLHELTAHMGLSEFVLFSSGAATLGAPGQGNYAAANAFLDALAQQRRAQGLAATSIAWGLWRETAGMGGALDDRGIERIRGLGMLALSNEQGLEMLDGALASDRALLVAMLLDLAALQAQARTWELPAPLRDLVRVATWRANDGGVSLAERLAAVPETEREEFMLRLVSGHVAAVLGYDAGEAIDPERAFGDLGLDSLGAVELRNRLSHMLGRRISATLVFDYPTVAEVARFLRVRLGPIEPPRPAIDLELDALERLLAAIEPQQERQRVNARLRGLLKATATPVELTSTEQIESSSAEEIFELLDRELTS